MIKYFEEATAEAVKHAQEEFPNESCGVIVDGEYNRCNNTHPEPEENFRINPVRYRNLKESGNIDAIMHSHNDYPHATKHDMEGQFKMAVPYGIINLRNGSLMHAVYFGDTLPTQKLKGRQFFTGVYDCYSLAIDFYKNYNCIIPNVARDVVWWNKGKNAFLDNIDITPFDIIDLDDIEPGDGVLMKVEKNSINHCAVYIGNGLMLHHLYNKLSITEPIGPWRQNIVITVRNKDFHKKRLSGEIGPKQVLKGVLNE